GRAEDRARMRAGMPPGGVTTTAPANPGGGTTQAPTETAPAAAPKRKKHKRKSWFKRLTNKIKGAVGKIHQIHMKALGAPLKLHQAFAQNMLRLPPDPLRMHQQVVKALDPFDHIRI